MAALDGESFARGSTLAVVGAIWKLLIQAVSLVVLSRLVAPVDFGAMAILLSISAVALLIGDLGLSTAALRAPRISDQQKSNLFWINVAVGGVLWGAAAVFSGPVAAIFDAPSLSWGLPIAASTVFFVLLGAQARTEINRRSDFTSLTWIEALAGLAGVIVAIALAAMKLGLLALILQQVVSAAVAGILFLFVARWLPSWPRRTPGMGEFLRFGAFTFAAQGVTFLSTNVDVWLIGRLWGLDPLGQYNRAMQIAKLPVTQLLPPLTRVALPHLRGMDPHTTAFVARLGRWRAGLSQPLVLGLALVAGAASPLVEIVLGPAWEVSAVLVPPLVLAAMFQVLGNPYYWVLLTIGNARAVFYSEALGRAIMVVAMLVVARWGVGAIAWAGAAGTAFIWFFQMRTAAALTALHLRTELLVGCRYLALACFAFGAVQLTDAMVAPVSPLADVAILTSAWLTSLAMAAAVVSPMRRDIAELLRLLRRG